MSRKKIVCEECKILFATNQAVYQRRDGSYFLGAPRCDVDKRSEATIGRHIKLTGHLFISVNGRKPHNPQDQGFYIR